MLSEENARIFAADGGLEGTTSGEYVEGRKYVVTKMAGKGKGQQLKLTCGAMGVNTSKVTGEHVKSYPYKELADWAEGNMTVAHMRTQEKKKMITLFKRDRSMDGTVFICDDADDAACIIGDLNRIARGAADSSPPSSPVQRKMDAERSAAAAAAGEPAAVRLDVSQQKLWAALMADEPDLAAIAVRVPWDAPAALSMPPLALLSH